MLCHIILLNVNCSGNYAASFAYKQIWVLCPHNASGYYTIYGDDSSYQDHFGARLVTGNTGELYARTGYLGFLRRTEAIGSDGGMHSLLCNITILTIFRTAINDPLVNLMLLPQFFHLSA